MEYRCDAWKLYRKQFNGKGNRTWLDDRPYVCVHECSTCTRCATTKYIKYQIYGMRHVSSLGCHHHSRKGKFNKIFRLNISYYLVFAFDPFLIWYIFVVACLVLYISFVSNLMYCVCCVCALCVHMIFWYYIYRLVMLQIRWWLIINHFEFTSFLSFK